MTIDLIERKTAAQKIIAKTQTPHDSIKIKDADELQCACATGALKKPSFSDVDFYFAAKILCIEECGRALPFELRFEIPRVADKARGIAISAEYLA